MYKRQVYDTNGNEGIPVPGSEELNAVKEIAANMGAGMGKMCIRDRYEVAGEWESRSGSPRVRIYRNPGRRGGGFYVEVSYKDGTDVYKRQA